jgi:hypothetical protein
MAQRIEAINPRAQVRRIEQFVTEDNVSELIRDPDLGLDCIDQVSAKAALIAHARGIDLCDHLRRGRWLDRPDTDPMCRSGPRPRRPAAGQGAIQACGPVMDSPAKRRAGVRGSGSMRSTRTSPSGGRSRPPRGRG